MQLYDTGRGSWVEILAQNIVLQAVADYRDALRTMNNQKVDKERRIKAGFKRDALRHFFQSDWYKQLTSLDGDALCDMLEADFERYGPRRWWQRRQGLDV